MLKLSYIAYCGMLKTTHALDACQVQLPAFAVLHIALCTGKCHRVRHMTCGWEVPGALRTSR